MVADIVTCPGWAASWRLNNRPRADHAWPSVRPVLGPPGVVSTTETTNMAGAAGTIVAYTTSTFHCGRQLTKPCGARYTIHVNFGPAEAEWAGRRSRIEASLADNWQRWVGLLSAICSQARRKWPMSDITR